MTKEHRIFPERRLAEPKIVNCAWLDEVGAKLEAAVNERAKVLTVDLMETTDVGLHEWVVVLAAITRALLENPPAEVKFEIKDNAWNLVKPRYLKQLFSKPPESVPGYTDHEQEESRRSYRLTGFLESLNTVSILDSLGSGASVMYPFIAPGEARARAHYTATGQGSHTVVFPLQLILDKGNCGRFASVDEIQKWRKDMGRKFPNSPIFEASRLWRDVLHELAKNILEHSNTKGLICVRVIQNHLCEKEDRKGNKYNAIKDYWINIFDKRLHKFLRETESGFVEISVCDFGIGLIERLRERYEDRFGDLKHEEDHRITAFAFDEFGTSKTLKDRALTERHALCHILDLVAEWDGVISIRSGYNELYFFGNEAPFERYPDHGGFRPNKIEPRRSIPGTQIHILLPLYPPQETVFKTRSVLSVSLPETFFAQSGHPRGHFVPLRDALGMYDPAITATDFASLKTSITDLVKSLAFSRPPGEALILDMHGIDNWDPPHFETLLYLCENLVRYRSFLITGVPEGLAKDVQEREWRKEKHLLDSSLAPEEYGDFSFSEALGNWERTPVLALDRDSHRHFFGLPSREFQDLMSWFVGAGGGRSWQEIRAEADSNITDACLKSVFNRNSRLVALRSGRWEPVWDEMALGVEHTRSVLNNFKEVVNRCGAWHGWSPENPRFDESFFLPWRGRWRSGFFEASNVFARERQIDEIAQRLIFRLGFGLEKLGFRLSDVDALAGSTAPAVQLACALRRWWPAGKEPRVLDLYYYVSEDASRAADLNPNGGPGRVVVVQDLLDKGEIRGKALELMKLAGLDVVAVIAAFEMDEEISDADPSDLSYGWDAAEGKPSHHSMMRIPRETQSPFDDADSKAA